MDLVTNFAGGISSSQFGEKTQGANTNLDLNDNTFENLLEKQLNNKVEENFMNLMNDSELVSGINLGEFDRNLQSFGTDSNTETYNAIKSLEKSEMEKFNNVKEKIFQHQSF